MNNDLKQRNKEVMKAANAQLLEMIKGTWRFMLVPIVVASVIFAIILMVML